MWAHRFTTNPQVGNILSFYDLCPAVSERWTTMAMISRGPFSNNLVDGDCSPSLGCKVFCRTPHCIGEWPGVNGLMTSPRRCHGYPTVPATSTRRRDYSFLWPDDQTRHMMSCGKKRREHLYCTGRNIIQDCWLWEEGQTFLIDIKSGKVTERCPKSMPPPEVLEGT